jgi:hypothetical protein
MGVLLQRTARRYFLAIAGYIYIFHNASKHAEPWLGWVTVGPEAEVGETLEIVVDVLAPLICSDDPSLHILKYCIVVIAFVPRLAETTSRSP